MLMLRAEVVRLLGDLGQPMGVRTWSSMVSRGQAPRPTRHVGRTPQWDETTIREWAVSRPGRGARTDLITRKTTPTTPEETPDA